jgi:hypothetical protein
MIIIEGPDGAGKSTLVQHLSVKYKIPVADKVVDENTNPIHDDLKHWTEANLKRGLQWMIFDRHRLISEPIYATAMGRPPQPGFDDLGWFGARMIDFTRIRPFIVYCLPAFEVVKSNIVNDEKNMVISPMISSIYAAYVAYAAGDIARGQAVHFDYGHDSDYSRIDMLLDHWILANHMRLMKAGRTE